MRVVTNDRHVAEQVKRDKGGVRREEWIKFWKVGREQNVKNVVMNGVKSGEVGKLENCKTDDGDVESE